MYATVTADELLCALFECCMNLQITLAYLVYWTGMLIDKTRGILTFFTGLGLSKSQADSLLSQLATDWQIEYDAIAELVAAAALLHIDETGWKVGERSCYTWIVSTLSTVLFKCGVGRGRAVLVDILGEQFDGIGVTDDYSAYQSQFSEHQLCWANCLRKAIALSLRNPDNRPYRRFFRKNSPLSKRKPLLHPSHLRETGAVHVRSAASPQTTVLGSVHLTPRKMDRYEYWLMETTSVRLAGVNKLACLGCHSVRLARYSGTTMMRTFDRNPEQRQ